MDNTWTKILIFKVAQTSLHEFAKIGCLPFSLLFKTALESQQYKE